MKENTTIFLNVWSWAMQVDGDNPIYQNSSCLGKYLVVSQHRTIFNILVQSAGKILLFHSRILEFCQ